ncbi:hypothetical protein H2200_007254 [Cladophialophora chaetospira]|uniref:Kinetochore protein fta4 n=1 Tax=Cladophialophora chaetospira TaxID=386627 RepID=A0AA38X7Z5_9EURO|nr:hypothetical protein H2200_007254 [Cladophialophora chaetospira]
MEESSITSLKSAFIRTQVRQLETPLRPPPPTEEGRLSDKQINDLVEKVNEKIRQHNRLIFSTQSQRHVAEQIESLHWNLVSEETEHAEFDTVIIRRDAELTESNTIQSLPEEYDDLHLHPDHEPQEHEVQRYTQLLEGLVELSQKRESLNKKLAQYRHLKKLMEPLNEPQKNVQPNLVTRDGELSQELDKMKALLARVAASAGKAGGSPGAGSRQTETVPQTEQQKLAKLMELG